MRTCDICGTPIPFGTDRCPSCGYRLKKEKNQLRGSYQKVSIPQFRKKEKTKKSSAELIKIFVTVFLVIIWLSVIVVQFIRVGTSIITPEIVYEETIIQDSYYSLGQFYPAVTKQVKPYYLYMCDISEDVYEIYELRGSTLEYALISSDVMYEGVAGNISMIYDYTSNRWEICYLFSDEEDINAICNAIVEYTKIEFEEIYDLTVNSELGAYQYFMREGIYEVQKYDGTIAVSYTQAINLEEK